MGPRCTDVELLTGGFTSACFHSTAYWAITVLFTAAIALSFKAGQWSEKKYGRK